MSDCCDGFHAFSNCFLNGEILRFWCLTTNQFKMLALHTMQRSTVRWNEWKILSLRFYNIATYSTENKNLVSAWHPCQKCIRWTSSSKEKTVQQSTFSDGCICFSRLIFVISYYTWWSIKEYHNGVRLFCTNDSGNYMLPKFPLCLFPMIVPHLFISYPNMLLSLLSLI